MHPLAAPGPLTVSCCSPLTGGVLGGSFLGVTRGDASHGSFRGVTVAGAFSRVARGVLFGGPRRQTARQTGVHRAMSPSSPARSQYEVLT